MGRPYVLVASVGLSPQVVTELIQELYVREGRLPRDVYLLTTRNGERCARRYLLGERCACLTRKGLTDARRPMANWLHLWNEILPQTTDRDWLNAPRPELQLRPTAVDDIETEDDDKRFANHCFDLIASLAREEERFNLLGVVAGGRKNMSGHLQNAFSFWALPDDRIYHVVVSHPEFEDSDFFFKDPAIPSHRNVEIRPIEVGFPRLRPILQKEVLDKLAEGPELHEEILSHLKRYLVRYSPVARIVIERANERNTKVTMFCDGGQKVIVSSLPPKSAALLYLLSQAVGASGTVVLEQLLCDVYINMRDEIYSSLGPQSDDASTPRWNDVETLRSAISQLRVELDKRPEFDGTITLSSYIQANTPFDFRSPVIEFVDTDAAAISTPPADSADAA